MGAPIQHLPTLQGACVPWAVNLWGEDGDFESMGLVWVGAWRALGCRIWGFWAGVAQMCAGFSVVGGRGESLSWVDP